MDALNPFRQLFQTPSFQSVLGSRPAEGNATVPGQDPTDSVLHTDSSQGPQLMPSPYKTSGSASIPFSKVSVGPVSTQYLEAQESDSINVREKEWYVAETDTRYVIDSGGCGAIKVFVDAAESSYSIVFHCDGTQESKEVSAHNIGSYVLSQKDKPKAVRILCLQPYSVSKDVMESVYKINNSIEEAGIPTAVRSVCLNNIDGEKHSKFIRLNLEGSEDQILGRYDDLVVKSRSMSEEDRAKKIALFQTVPMNLRTSEFIKEWSSLSVDEAKERVDKLSNKDKKWSLRGLFSRAA